MKLGVLLLKTFGYIWAAMVFCSVIAELQPFNATNYVITLIAFAPTFLAFVLASWLRKRLNGRR